MRNTKDAFRWIVGLLRRRGIRFQITGGLAARAYGSRRPLADIDIDVRDRDLPKIAPVARPFIRFGPGRYRDRNWDLRLLTLRYRGQLIDIGGTDSVSIFDRRTKRWIRPKARYGLAKHKYLYGSRVPVVCRRDLVSYKSRLSRQVDVVDLRAIESISGPRTY